MDNSLDNTINKKSILSRKPTTTTRRTVRDNYEIVEKTIYEKDPILMDKFVNSVEKLFILVAEVQTLKSHNQFLIARVAELEEGNKNSNKSTNANDELLNEYKQKLKKAENDLRELRSEKSRMGESGVHLKVLEDQNAMFKAKLKEVEGELDIKKKKYEKRLLDLNSVYKTTLKDLDDYKKQCESLKVEIQDKNAKLEALNTNKDKYYRPPVSPSDFEDLKSKNEELAAELQLVKKEASRKENDFAVKVNKLETKVGKLKTKNKELEEELGITKSTLRRENMKSYDNTELNDLIKKLKAERSELENDKCKLQSENTEMKLEINSLKTELELQKTNGPNVDKTNENNEKLLNMEIEHLKKINALTENKLKEANDLLFEKIRALEELGHNERKRLEAGSKSGQSVYEDRSRAHPPSFTSVNRNNDEQNLSVENLDRNPEEVVQQIKETEIQFKNNEIDILGEEAHNLDRILSANNNFMQNIAKDDAEKKKMANTNDFSRFMNNMTYNDNYKPVSPAEAVDNLIMDEEDSTQYQIETMQALKDDLSTINELQNKNADNLNQHIAFKDKVLEVLEGFTKYKGKNIEKPSIKAYKGDASKSLAKNYTENKEIEKNHKKASKLQKQVRQLFENNQRIFNEMMLCRKNLNNNARRYTGMLKRYSMGHQNNIYAIQTPAQDIDTQLNKQYTELELLEAELSHVNKLNEGNHIHLEQLRETLLAKDNMIKEYLKRLDTLLNKENEVKHSGYNVDQRSFNESFSPNKEAIATNNQNRAISPNFGLPLNKNPTGARVNPEPHGALNQDNRTPHALQNDSGFYRFADTNEMNAYGNSRYTDDRNPSHSRYNETGSNLNNSFNKNNEEQRIIRIQKDENYSNPSVIKELHYLKGDRSYSPIYSQSRSIVHPLHEKVSGQNNASSMDIGKLQQILRQKPFYITNLNDIPQRILDIINELEEHKYRLVKNGKDIEKFLNTIEYISHENELLKNRTGLKDDKYLLEELQFLKDSLNRLEKKSDDLINENEGLLRNIEKLKTERQNYKRELERVYDNYDADYEQLKIEHKKLILDLKKAQDENLDLNRKIIQLERIEGARDQRIDLNQRYHQDSKKLNDEVFNLRDLNRRLNGEVKHLKAELAQLSDDLRSKSNQVDKYKAEAELKDKEIAFIKNKLSDSAKYDDTMMNDYFDRSTSTYAMKRQGPDSIFGNKEDPVLKKEKEIKHLNEKLKETENFYKQQIDSNEKTIIDLRSKTDDIDRENKVLEAKLNETEKAVNDKDNTIKQLEDEVGKLKGDISKLDHCKDQAKDLEGVIRDKDKYINDINKELEGIKPLVDKFNDLHQLTDDLRDELQRYKDKLAEAKRQIAALHSERDVIVDHMQKIKGKAEELEVTNDRKIKMIGALNIKTFILMTEIEKLQEFSRCNRRTKTRRQNDEY